ncbi:hypothetical protein LCGC14_1348300 [marine sediment metagenome]|uniref:Uncharacterized protein n=1 Tax=marine sediment metagenome TaxID=412755 RepID=A0A0F9KXM4_9ZZZZ
MTPLWIYLTEFSAIRKVINVMVEKKDDKLNILTAADRTSLEKLNEQIAKGEKTIALLEELGLGVGDMKAKLAWSKKRTGILLEKG